MPRPQECIWSRYHLDLWPMTFKTLSAVATHVTNSCVRFHWNLSTKYGDIVSCEIGVNGRQHTNGRTDGRPEHTSLSPPIDAGGSIKGKAARTCQCRCSCSSFCSNSFMDRCASASRSLLATSSSCRRWSSGERSSSVAAADELTAVLERHLSPSARESLSDNCCCCCCDHPTQRT